MKKTEYEIDYVWQETARKLCVIIPMFILLFFAWVNAFANPIQENNFKNAINALEQKPFSSTEFEKQKFGFPVSFDVLHTTKFITGWEKFEPKAYKDLNGNGYVIGYGFHAKGRKTISKRYADSIIAQEVLRLKRSIDTVFNKKFTREQYTALISLQYNLGGRSFDKMPIFKDLILAGKGEKEWVKWFSYSNGTYYRGLEKRRKEEVILFFNK